MKDDWSKTKNAQKLKPNVYDGNSFKIGNFGFCLLEVIQRIGWTKSSESLEMNSVATYPALKLLKLHQMHTCLPYRALYY